jgi:hypothetical protein
MTSKKSVAHKGTKEHRVEPRFRVRWKTTAFVDAQGLHQGSVKDISTKGAAVLLDRNLRPHGIIKLHIYIPPPHTSKISCIVEVYGQIIYSIYDGHEQLFRIGVTFLKFHSESDPAFLEKYLTSHLESIVF